jgi:hypothetical protein
MGWAENQGFTGIQAKSENRHNPLLLFSLAQGFAIKSTQRNSKTENLEVLLDKDLLAPAARQI